MHPKKLNFFFLHMEKGAKIQQANKKDCQKVFASEKTYILHTYLYCILEQYITICCQPIQKKKENNPPIIFEHAIIKKSRGKQCNQQTSFTDVFVFGMLSMWIPVEGLVEGRPIQPQQSSTNWHMLFWLARIWTN